MGDAGELIDLLRTFNLEADRFVEVFTRAHGLHRTDLNAVAYIWRAAEEDKPLTPGELARKLRLSPAATTALLDRLTRAGHVERRHDTADRRRVHLEMQPSARALAQAFFTPLGQHLRAAFDEFDDEALDAATRVLIRVNKATAKAADEARSTA
ncbi:MarR family winged helix-turn-helix transcriptional regulator [Dactylosporangium siamense]|uniref:MarR family winged helix-turn-helix transcriptional regulator n=1 Tax=Dactylosporangium siamense TaxID=685454 RepID=UPI0019417EF6|nr:MarR family transcriptional regulator [Dactylosporangium siamense]